ncbi:methylated-DNA--[protein]-cysteine S-methyltransferase [bacterium]|nr:MAG: methylated-DNA--[protein]-cysteine S-methyltransferase [bacterium]
MTTYERVEKVIRYIEQNGSEQPRLAVLAKVAGLSESRFHRLFHRWAGTTPKAFLKFVTNARAKELLRDSQDLLGASLELGLSGPGRLHDLFVTLDGVTPGEFKAGGKGLVLRWGFHETPFGTALIALTARGVCHFSFGGERPRSLAVLKRRWPRAAFRQDRAETGAVLRKVFSRKGRVPVSLAGTPFQVKVWEALLRIPPGRAASYGQVAAAAGRSKAVRAVGTAVGENPVAFLIPCHRVLRSTGALGGYRWGTARKRAILAWEAAKRVS